MILYGSAHDLGLGEVCCVVLTTVERAVVGWLALVGILKTERSVSGNSSFHLDVLCSELFRRQLVRDTVSIAFRPPYDFV